MNKRHFLIIEAILKHPDGLTRNEINEMLTGEGQHLLSRQSFDELRHCIFDHMGVRIYAHNCGKNIWRYRIDRAELEDYDRDQLIGNLVANMLQSEFLKEFRDLGTKIQPLIIARGTEYLRPIGNALRLSRKLLVTYQKFNEASYEAILHPYCLKAFSGRWYLFAFKENSDHPDAQVQCFSLDRIKSIKLMDECFRPNSAIDPSEYFRDAYGIWVDPKGYPVEDIIVACTPHVANYLRSLPLHHTQTEIDLEVPVDKPELTCHFSYHISVTPDFLGEINKWGNEIEILRQNA